MIILARHGNTFETGEKPVWVGARTDLPLTEEGRAQATRVVSHLRSGGRAPKAVFAGPLRRTKEFASIVASAFDLPVEIDDSLKELDYGGWEGLDGETVASRFGAAVLGAWEGELVWPGERSDWGESPDIVKSRVQAVLDRLATSEQPVFACTSNGILRFVWALTRGLVDMPQSKVKPGAVCVLKPAAQGFDIVEWNCIPSGTW